MADFRTRPDQEFWRVIAESWPRRFGRSNHDGRCELCGELRSQHREVVAPFSATLVRVCADGEVEDSW